MASVLQLISAIEGIANTAIDITRIVTHRLGIPPELIADLSNAEEVSHRVWVRDDSHMVRRSLAALELPVAAGMCHGDSPRPFLDHRYRRRRDPAARRRAVCPRSPAGLVRLHELAAALTWEPPAPATSGALTELDRAVDVLVEMKNISEAAVGLAYSALALRDDGLASEVLHLAERLDEMKDHLQLEAARRRQRRGSFEAAGLLQLSQAAEESG
jgi:uncharacterized protein with PhoU and TrkA domain